MNSNTPYILSGFEMESLVVDQRNKVNNSTDEKDTIVGLDNENQNSNIRSNDCIQFLKIFFDFGFFLCYTPFRFKKDSEGIYRIYRNCFQQVLCAITHIFILFRCVTSIRKVQIDEVTKDPVVYYELILYIISLVYHFTFISVLWIKQKNFYDVIQDLQFPGYLPTQNIVKTKPMAVIICSLYTIYALSNPVMGEGLQISSDWDLQWLYRSYTAEAKYSFFLETYDSLDSPPQIADIKSWDIGLTALMIIINTWRNIAGAFIDLAILMCVFTLYYPTRALGKSIYFYIYEKSSTEILTHTEIETVEQYYALKRLSDKINVAIGISVLIYLTQAIPNYSSHMILILTSDDWFEKSRFFLHCGINVFILCLAASICTQIEGVRLWLSIDENGSAIPQYKLTLLLDELSSKPIGLSGGGVFRITYSTLITLLGVIVFYFILVLQYKATK